MVFYSYSDSIPQLSISLLITNFSLLITHCKLKEWAVQPKLHSPEKECMVSSLMAR